jgi:Zn finger protein HypA/HybF involved in hydrogenase expression
MSKENVKLTDLQAKNTKCLSDDELQDVAGGIYFPNLTCPDCGGHEFQVFGSHQCCMTPGCHFAFHLRAREH